MSDAPRDEKGRLQAGNNLRKTSAGLRAKKISRFLNREFIRRYENVELAPGEKLGKERALMMHYMFLMDIMQNPEEKAQDRIKAIVELGNRKDGKPVDIIQLSGPDGAPMEMKTVSDDNLTPSQKLAQALKSLGILAQHGGVNASGEVDGVGADADSGDEGAAGEGGGGEQAP